MSFENSDTAAKSRFQDPAKAREADVPTGRLRIRSRASPGGDHDNLTSVNALVEEEITPRWRRRRPARRKESARGKRQKFPRTGPNSIDYRAWIDQPATACTPRAARKSIFGKSTNKGPEYRRQGGARRQAAPAGSRIPHSSCGRCIVLCVRSRSRAEISCKRTQEPETSRSGRGRDEGAGLVRRAS